MMPFSASASPTRACSPEPPSRDAEQSPRPGGVKGGEAGPLAALHP